MITVEYHRVDWAVDWVPTGAFIAPGSTGEYYKILSMVPWRTGGLYHQVRFRGSFEKSTVEDHSVPLSTVEYCTVPLGTNVVVSV